MKNVLLASVALVFVAATTSFAATPIENQATPRAKPIYNGLQMLADNDGDGGGNSGSGGDDGADHDSGDDHGGSSDNDDSDDNDDNDNDDSSNSSRSKPRVPGGSGCDSARDRAEHPECAG
jgi:hypothetical protein